MKNLKKVLALVLAMSTVFGLSVSANAAATDYTDYDEIQNKEAVEVMSALKVIDGYNTGDFKPEGYLTRAEMCKMVAYVMNGGKDPVLGTSSVYRYTDTANSWARDYIEYASDMGIVSGIGHGKFDPQGTLTGVQAAKMMLTAMGYDAKVFGFTGSGWDISVNRYANEAGLYDGLSDMQPNLPITRDQAAQLMYNAIQATMMKRSWSQDITTGQLTETYVPWTTEDENGVSHSVTLLGQKFNGAIRIGYMSDFTYDAVKDVWTYTFDSTSNTFGGKVISAQDRIGDNVHQKSEEDYTGFFGQQVKVIYNTKDEDVTYGIYANDSTVVVEGATGNVEDYNDTSDNVTVSGKDYKLDKDADEITVYNFGDKDTTTTLHTLKSNATATNRSAYTFKMVDNTGDGKIDAVVRTPMTIAKINYVGKDSIQFSNGVDTQKIDGLTTYEGYAAGDWVCFIDRDNAVTRENTIQKIELKTGAVSGVRGGANANAYTEYQLNGAWLAATGDTKYTGNIVNADVNDTIEYVSLGSTIFYSKITDIAATTKNIAMIVTVGIEEGSNNSTLSGDALQAKLLFGDGTTKTVNVSKVDGKDVEAKDADAATLLGMIGTLVTYRVDGSDYELMAVKKESTPGAGDANLAGYDKFDDSNTGYSNGKINNIELADDAVVYFIGDTDAGTMETSVISTSGNTSAARVDDGDFYANSTRQAAVYTGKEIKNTWGTDSKTISKGDKTGAKLDYTAVLTQEINGFTYAKVAIIRDETDLPEITSGSNYGYLSAPTFRTVTDGKTYLNYTIFTADGVLEVKEENTDAADLYPQGAVITYDVVSDGVVKNVNIADVTTGKVTGWDGESKIALDNVSTKIDSKDTTILYVDSSRKVGVEGGSIQKAADVNGDGTVDLNNVRYILSGSNDYVVFLLVDVDNEMAPNPVATSLGSGMTLADLQEALQYNGTVNVAGSLGSISLSVGDIDLNGATLNVGANTTITINGDLYMNGGTLAGTGKVIATGTTHMGSTLSIAEFETQNAEIAAGKTMNIIGGTVTIKGSVTGDGKLAISNSTNVTVTGNVEVDVAASGDATLACDGKITGTVTGNKDNVYVNKDDVAAASVKVVKG